MLPAWRQPDMILLLQYSAGGTRGGERYTGRFHAFIKSRFNGVEPSTLQARPAEFNSIIRHARVSLKAVKLERPALIVTDISSGARNLYAVSWAKKHGSKLLLIIQERRTTYRYKSTLSKWLIHYFEDRLIGLADIILVNSKYIAAYAAKRADRNAKVILAYPGLEINTGHDNSSLEHHSDINLLAVGECTEPRKGIRYLLEAMPLLSGLPVKLHLAGGYSKDAPFYKTLMEIIERNSLGERIVFHGYLSREKLADLYGETDIFVLPSLSEGYGMVLAEALVFGLPIVASKVAAIPELVDDGINALLVRPRDPQALASAIRKLAVDSDLRIRMRKANFIRAANLPTWGDFELTLEKELVPIITKLTGIKAK
jgi:glycosyltransferase involved in cell wall biosynthesis